MAPDYVGTTSPMELVGRAAPAQGKQTGTQSVEVTPPAAPGLVDVHEPEGLAGPAQEGPTATRCRTRLFGASRLTPYQRRGLEQHLTRLRDAQRLARTQQGELDRFLRRV